MSKPRPTVLFWNTGDLFTRETSTGLYLHSRLATSTAIPTVLDKLLHRDELFVGQKFSFLEFALERYRRMESLILWSDCPHCDMKAGVPCFNERTEMHWWGGHHYNRKPDEKLKRDFLGS